MTARISDGRPVTMATSAKFSDDAWTLMRTSSAFGTGRATVWWVRTVSGAPYALWTIACMVRVSVSTPIGASV